jgi:hypothetical protein
LAEVYPAGFIYPFEDLLIVSASWDGPQSSTEGQNAAGIRLVVDSLRSLATDSFDKALKQVEKMGKKKFRTANEGGRKINLLYRTHI